MSQSIRFCSALATLSLFFIFLASDLGAATTEESLANINRLPPAERQAALVKEAKNKKMVVWYAPMNREDLRQFTTGFEAEYIVAYSSGKVVAKSLGKIEQSH